MVLALASECSFAQSSGEFSGYEKVFKKITEEVDKNSEAWRNLRNATSVGHRMTGTEPGNKAERNAVKLLEDYGFKQVERQPFELNVWQRKTAFLDFVPRNSDNFISVNTVSLALTPLSTDLLGDLVDVGSAMPEDFERLKGSIQGKIVLANLWLPEGDKRENLHRSEKVALAEKAGAAGVIFCNGAPGNVLLTGTASVTNELTKIPALCIGKYDAAEVRKWLTEVPMMAELKVGNTYSRERANNVIAKLEGTDKDAEPIVVGGHLDSWDLATGATDNGIGAFTIIEVARVFKSLNLKPKRTILFCLFMGEEQGLLGSTHFIKQLKEGKRKNEKMPGYMLNLDMAGNAKGFNIGGRTEAKRWFELLNKEIREADTSFKGLVSEGMHLHSDHQPFMLEGVPVCSPMADLPKEVYDCYHSDCDDMHLLKPEYLNRSAKFSAMLLYALANTKKLPASKLSRSELEPLLQKNGLIEKLKISGEW